MSRVRTRFAPSPTGTLHVGNARTAIVNWLIARHHGGEFILRIEDTDVERNVAGAEARLMADLQWLGLDWDEGPDPDGEGERGERGPYHQSRRSELYHRDAHRLLDQGVAYRCFCTPDALEAARREAIAAGRSPRYAGTCRSLDAAEAARRADAGEAFVIRLETPAQGDIVVDDVIRGRVTFDAGQIGDFVLLRSDGLPTYNFAVVVDDVEMDITHVIRGAGHLSNTPHQLLLYRALARTPPVFAHTPTVLGEDRSKLSKRSGAQALSELREKGFHPDAVVNYLSLLGWSSPSGDEVLVRDRLVREVTLDRMNAGDVVYDPGKMRWLSGKHIETMPLAALRDAVRPYVAASPFAPLLDGPFDAVLTAVRSHLTTFGEITDHLAPFMGPGPGVEPAFDDDAVRVLRAVRNALAEVVAWEPAPIQAALKTGGEAAEARGAALYVPVRRAVTGAEHGPPLAAILAVQGREQVLRLLDRVTGDRADAV
ncbi:MAG: glutamate--tRNA ligase [Gemmatimonadota bacterium]